MKTILIIFIMQFPLMASSNSLFDDAIELIKECEQWHGKNSYPYVGWGHRIVDTDRITLPITEIQADSILRSDLMKKMECFNLPYREKLLLGVLSYNIGQNKVHGSKLEQIIISGGSTSSIRKEYCEFRLWHGKIISSIEKRREKEFNLIML